MLHISAVHCLREIFRKRSLEVEIKPYTLNNEVSNYVTVTYFRQYLIYNKCTLTFPCLLSLTCNTYKVTKYKVSYTTSHNTNYKVGTNKTCVNSALIMGKKINAVIKAIKRINRPTALVSTSFSTLAICRRPCKILQGTPQSGLNTLKL